MAVKVSSQLEHYNTALNVALGKYIDLSTTGAPDIGVALADADTILVGDGGSGTPANTKTATMTRLATYMQSNLTFTADTNTQNTYTSSWVDDSDDVLLRLTGGGATSGTQDIKLVAGSGITLTPSGTNMTIASTAADGMGSGFTVSATTDTTATTITEGEDLFFAAGTGITCETTADGTVTITNTGASFNVTADTGTIGGSSAVIPMSQGKNLNVNVTRGSSVAAQADADNFSIDLTVDSLNVSATSRVLGRISAGAGNSEELTGANLQTICGTTWALPFYMEAADDRGEPTLHLTNTAAAGSTDESVAINFHHVENTIAGAKIICSRGENYSTSAERSANLTFKTTKNNDLDTAAVLQRGDVNNQLTLGGADTVPFRVQTGGAANLVLATNSGTDSGTISIIDGANGDIDIHPNGTGTTDISNVEFTTYATYASEVVNVNTAGAINEGIDWRDGNKQKVTQTNDTNLNFTNDPVNPCSLILKVVQGAADSLITSWTTSSSAEVYWAGETAPTLSTASGAIDIITFYFDGTDYYGACANNFGN